MLRRESYWKANRSARTIFNNFKNLDMSLTTSHGLHFAVADREMCRARKLKATNKITHAKTQGFGNFHQGIDRR